MPIATRPAIPSDFPTAKLTNEAADLREETLRLALVSSRHPGLIACRGFGCLTMLPKFSGRVLCRFHQRGSMFLEKFWQYRYAEGQDRTSGRTSPVSKEDVQHAARP